MEYARKESHFCCHEEWENILRADGGNQLSKPEAQKRGSWVWVFVLVPSPPTSVTLD